MCLWKREEKKELNAGREREMKGVGKKEGMKGEGAVRINTR